MNERRRIVRLIALLQAMPETQDRAERRRRGCVSARIIADFDAASAPAWLREACRGLSMRRGPARRHGSRHSRSGFRW
jgi:hypothetical protein